MTVEQALVGAMGCASWRARNWLSEYVEAARVGGAVVVRGGALVIDGVDARGLNEVGVTDAVMAALWRYGPVGASYAVSSRAESAHLGADIAIVHDAKKRVLLYQAKLAHLASDEFEMKSPVTKTQVTRLRRSWLKIGSQNYTVTGRLALYQVKDKHHHERCQDLCQGFFRRLAPRHGPWGELGWDRWPSSQKEPSLTLGSHYYDEVMFGCRCSPSGILAAPVPDTGGAKSVAKADTWPWEFDTYEWLHSDNGTPPPRKGAAQSIADRDRDRPRDGYERWEPPKFARYRSTGPRSEADAESSATDDSRTTLTASTGDRVTSVADLANQIREQLGLPDNWMLLVLRV